MNIANVVSDAVEVIPYRHVIVDSNIVIQLGNTHWGKGIRYTYVELWMVS